MAPMRYIGSGARNGSGIDIGAVDFQSRVVQDNASPRSLESWATQDASCPAQEPSCRPQEAQGLARDASCAAPRYPGGVPIVSWAAPIVLVLAQNASGGAWSTGRPAECDLRGGYGAAGGRSGNVWERAKSPELRRYCNLVASAASKLAGTTAMAEAALASAREAEQVLPGHAAPRVLEGRALAALGKLDEAFKALTEARRATPPRSTIRSRCSRGRAALARTGSADGAAEAYRAFCRGRRRCPRVRARVGVGRGGARGDGARGRRARRGGGGAARGAP